MQLGRYEIIEELGRGGFGIVYKARDPALDVFRAVKTLHPALILDPKLLGRFTQEAKLAAKLDHPNLVPVYDMGEDNGRWFIAMKYMEGGALIDWFDRKGPLPYQKVVDVLGDICSGLSFAHENGIVHRDLKPGNILFDESGHARISDLGFAKALNASGSVSLSATGAMIGTPPYMAPEIWQGKTAAPATDIYSLGCIFYEMLAGQVLFQGESPADVMTKHIMEQPEIPLHWSEHIRSVLGKALQKEPERRHQTANAFLDHLVKEEDQNAQSHVTADLAQLRNEPLKKKARKKVLSHEVRKDRRDISRSNFLVWLNLICSILSIAMRFIHGFSIFRFFLGNILLTNVYFEVRNIRKSEGSQKKSTTLEGLSLVLNIMSIVLLFIRVYLFFRFNLIGALLGITALIIECFNYKKITKFEESQKKNTIHGWLSRILNILSIVSMFIAEMFPLSDKIFILIGALLGITALIIAFFDYKKMPKVEGFRNRKTIILLTFITIFIMFLLLIILFTINWY